MLICPDSFPDHNEEQQRYGKSPEVSADAFETVGIDVHELVGFEQRFDLGPATGEQGVKFISAEIAEP